MSDKNLETIRAIQRTCKANTAGIPLTKITTDKTKYENIKVKDEQ